MADWTTGEVALLTDMKRRGLTDYAIGRLLGRGEGSVRGCVSRHGAVVRPRWDAAEVAFLTEWYRQMGARWCAERLMRSEKAVWDKARRLGLSREGGGGDG